MCRTIQWDYEQERPNKGDVFNKDEHIFIFSTIPREGNQRSGRDERYLTILYNDLVNNTREEYCMKDYDRFFTVTSTPKRGRKVTPKEEAMREAARNYAISHCFQMKSTIPSRALSFYRSKDIVEKGFGNLKDPLNFRRMQVSSELSLNGKLFCQLLL